MPCRETSSHLGEAVPEGSGKMLCRLILLGFGAVTLIEIALFIVIGQAFGVLSTLLAVLLMAMLGVAIIRRQGLSVLAQLRATMDTGKLPGRTIGDAMLVGLLDRFEIWNPERYHKAKAADAVIAHEAFKMMD